MKQWYNMDYFVETWFNKDYFIETWFTLSLVLVLGLILFSRPLEATELSCSNCHATVTDNYIEEVIQSSKDPTANGLCNREYKLTKSDKNKLEKLVGASKNGVTKLYVVEAVYKVPWYRSLPYEAVI